MIELAIERFENGVAEVAHIAEAAAAKPGELPSAERRSLHRNFYWIKQRGGEDKLVHDAIHASSSGHYLLGCVWFEFLFGESVLDNPYQSPYVAAEDTPILKRIAHAVVGGRSN